MKTAAPQTLYEIIREAVAYFSARGFTSQQDFAVWAAKIEAAAEREFIPHDKLEWMFKTYLGSVYKRHMRDLPKWLKQPRYNAQTAQRLQSDIFFKQFSQKPALEQAMRRQLDAKIFESANLIKLKKTQRVAETLARFQGWVSSIPPGGTKEPNKINVATEVRKPLQRLKYEERRVLIDQGHKLNSSISQVLAEGAGALAAIWHSHWKQEHYNYRPDHKDRDKKVYVIKGNWALAAGLMRVGEAGYTDDITAPAEEINCRCYYEYIYNLDALPPELLTKKGAAKLVEIEKEFAL